MADFNGGPGNDTFTGDGSGETINGNGGDDTLNGGGGADTIDGGDGQDTLSSAAAPGSWQHSYFYIDPVVPILDTGTEVDTIRGGAGVDLIFAGYGDNVDGGADGALLFLGLQGASAGVTVDFNGLSSNGTLTIGGGTITNITAVEFVDGSNFADTITAGSIGNVSPDIRGLGGDDHLIAGYYWSNLYGGDGNDILDDRPSAYGGYLYGEDGNDTLYMTSNNAAYGGAGDDTFFGFGTFYGGTGNDTFNFQPTVYPVTGFGDEGVDVFNGTDGAETMYGGADADTLHGGGGNDQLFSAGTRDAFNQLDVVDRGTDHDQLFGDAGNDSLSIGYGDDADGGDGTNTLTLSLIGAGSGVTFNGDALAAGSITIGGGTIKNIQSIDHIYGSNFADTITLHTQDSPTTVDGGGGDDHLTGAGSTVTFYGGDGNDTLVGSSVADTLYGGAGADSISGAGGDDAIIIQSGDIAAGETIDGGTGNDTVSVLYNNQGYTDLSGATFTNVETLSATAVKVTLGQLAAFSTFQASNVLLATGGSVSLAGVHFNVSGTVTFSDNATSFDMTGAIPPSTSGYTIQGGGAADTITTLDGNDTIDGGGGNDVINSGGGNDLLAGGAGTDTFHAGDGNDTITVTGTGYTGGETSVAGEVYDGGAGDDSLNLYGAVDISGATLTGIENLGVDLYGSVSLTGSQLQSIAHITSPGYSGYPTEMLNLTNGGAIAYGGTAYGVVTFNLAAADTAFDLSGMTYALGVTVNGNSGNDTITGSQFADTLNGGGGNDVLYGGPGADTMSGGTGNDVYYVVDSGDVVTEQTSAGTDEVRTTLASTTLAINVENLTGLLSTGQTLNGNILDNSLTGGAGDDVLDGKTGADTMIGGAGNDIYYIDNAGDIVTEQSNGGTDEVRTTLASYTLAANVENLTGLATTGQTLTGNSADNVLTGGSGADKLDGGGGNDSLYGGAGNDTLTVTLTGDAVLTGTYDGGPGDDTLAVNGPISGSSHADFSGATLANIEHLIVSWTTAEFTTAQLSANFNSISGAVQLTDGGTLSLTGKIVTNAHILLAAADTVVDASGAAAAGVWVQGNSGYDTITGTGGDDYLYGGGGADVINGGDGNDTIAGGTGLDVLHGGAGDDQLYVYGAADLTAGETYDGGDGYDFLNFGVSPTLDPYTVDISGVTLTSIEALMTEANTVQLTSGQLMSLNKFEGHVALTTGGSLALTSLVVTPTLTIDLAAAGNAIDLSGMNTPLSSTHITVNGSGVDDYVIGTSVIDTLNGGGGNDTLIGGAGNDFLDGGTGTDALYGGIGNDTFSTDRQDDLVFENAGEGTDTVVSTANFYLYANIENLLLASGAGNLFGVGNELANTITGNEGDNTLLAGAGDDVVHAGAGVDIVYGEAGNDTLNGDAGNDFLAGGDGNDTIDGGAGGDSVYGEAGNDILYGGTTFEFDILVGGDGNDVLHGDSGLGDYDYLYGNAGDDSFYVDTGDDLTFEQPGEGTDTVYANVAGANNGVYLYANVENLVLLGTTTFGVGNELDNHLTGNASANWLLGGAGNDVLNGKAGNDVLFGEAGADTFVFEHGTGGDVIGDFTPGTDKIDLSAFGFTDYQTVVNAMHEVNGTTAIDLGGGDFIVLNGVANASLHASDFILSSGSSAQAPLSEQIAAKVNEAPDEAHGWRAGLVHALDRPDLTFHFDSGLTV